MGRLLCRLHANTSPKRVLFNICINERYWKKLILLIIGDIIHSIKEKKI
jgi:hypothetical protein